MSPRKAKEQLTEIGDRCALRPALGGSGFLSGLRLAAPALTVAVDIAEGNFLHGKDRFCRQCEAEQNGSRAKCHQVSGRMRHAIAVHTVRFAMHPVVETITARPHCQQ